MDMKKIMMFAAIAAAAFSSCSNSELVDVSSGRAIGFETFVGKASTKGVPVSGNKFGDGATIKVWGFTTTAQMGTDFTESPTEIPGLKETVVTKSGNSWSYSPTAYWQAQKAHTFFACAPGEAECTFNNGVFSYTVKDAVADQVDFMVADALKNAPWTETDVDPAKQSFAFRHALSQIKYSVGITQASDLATDVKVKSVKIEALVKNNNDQTASFSSTGNINVVGRENSTSDLAWTDLSGSATSYTVTANPEVELGTVQSPVEYKPVNEGTGDILMLLPQKTQGNVRFTITVTYTDKDSKPAEGSAMFITTAEQEWSPNKIYHYKFGISMPQVLEQKPIIFDDENMNIEVWNTTETVLDGQGEAFTPAP